MNKRTIQLSVVATSIVVAATLALTTLLVNDENPTQSPKVPQRGVTPETRDAAATPTLKAPARRRRFDRGRGRRCRDAFQASRLVA